MRPLVDRAAGCLMRHSLFRHASVLLAKAAKVAKVETKVCDSKGSLEGKSAAHRQDAHWR